MKCNEMLLSAYTDGELSGLQRRSVQGHLRNCPTCAARHAALAALRGRIRDEVPRHAAPAQLRARVLATVDAVRAATPAVRGAPRVSSGRWAWMGGGAIAGSAATVLAFVLGTAALDWRAGQDLASEAVASHVRATLSDRLVQVPSSDRHTVKPWLSARLDYSPPVKDFAAEGFPLVGGRVDYLDGHAVATLVYRYRNHTIDVYVRPGTSARGGAMLHPVRGFNVVRAEGWGMDWLAVSDVGTEVLAPFVARVAAQSGLP